MSDWITEYHNNKVKPKIQSLETNKANKTDLNGSPATIVVAASDSVNKDGADYICDGTDDQVKINAAITALPSNGGRVLLLEGTYNLTNKVSLKSNISIEGMGRGNTKLLFNTANGSDRVIDGSYVSNISIEALTIVMETAPRGWSSCIVVDHSNNIHYNDVETSGSQWGMNCHGLGFCVTNCYVHDSYYGIAGTCRNSIISNNIVVDCTQGIRIETDGGTRAAGYNNIIGNVVYRGTGATTDYSSSQYTIIITGTYNLVSNNLIPGKDYTNSGGNTNTFANNKYN